MHQKSRLKQMLVVGLAKPFSQMMQIMSMLPGAPTLTHCKEMRKPTVKGWVSLDVSTIVL
jgi:hypothetical protein